MLIRSPNGNAAFPRVFRCALILTAAFSGLSAGIALVPGAAAASHPVCKAMVTRLPDLGFGSEVDAQRGETFVGSVQTDGSGDQLPAIWRDGHLRVLDTFTSSPAAAAADINSRGEVVGAADNSTVGFVYRDGVIHVLPSSGSNFIDARRINSRGQIAGTAFDNLYAARWESYTSAPVELLPAAGDAFSVAEGINDGDTVAGHSDDPTGVPHAALWSATGQVRLLKPGFGVGQPGDLFAISNPGEAVGESFLIDSSGNIVSDQATAWPRGDEPKLIPFLPGTNQSTALEVSDRGWVVGGAAPVDYVNGVLGPIHALVWFGGRAAETLPVPGLSYGESQSLAHNITAAGTVVGSSGPADGFASATVWTCARALAYIPSSFATVARAGTHTGQHRRHLRLQAFLNARRRQTGRGGYDLGGWAQPSSWASPRRSPSGPRM